MNNGGPAFTHEANAFYNERSGMTLRDYFAAKAMQAMISHRYKVHEFVEEDASNAAYEVADAMIRARDL